MHRNRNVATMRKVHLLPIFCSVRNEGKINKKIFIPGMYLLDSGNQTMKVRTLLNRPKPGVNKADKGSIALFMQESYVSIMRIVHLFPVSFCQDY